MNLTGLSETLYKQNEIKRNSYSHPDSESVVCLNNTNNDSIVFCKMK